MQPFELTFKTKELTLILLTVVPSREAAERLTRAINVHVAKDTFPLRSDIIEQCIRDAGGWLQNQYNVAAYREWNKGSKAAIVMSYHKGRLHDPSSLIPAEQMFDHDGSVAARRRYQNGRLHDSEYGAAEEVFTSDGKLSKRSRYQHGQLHDGPNGEPAAVSFNNDGSIYSQSRYQQGQLHDGPNREPAHEWFHPDTGKIFLRERYLYGMRSCNLRGPAQGPAVEKYYEDGTLACVERYSAGRRHNTLDADGLFSVPAIEKYGRDGTLVETVHYNGEPRSAAGPTKPPAARPRGRHYRA